ncbi:MAG: phenylacetate--CoA ligase family protein [Planctomycetes bacterium]|nr:phenylacetate--CoA ligase family protein [Planctomycetota bacterium]
MGRNDCMTAAELGEVHDRLLVEHLRRAARHVPFYRERVDADDIRTPDDLARFPLLDKPTIRAAGDQLRSEAWRGRAWSMETGGSSGEPLRFITDNEREASAQACKLRARAWWGLHPGHRETDLWGSPIETGRQDMARRIAQGVLGFQLLSAFRLNEETMGGFRARLEGGRADFVYGYPSAMATYARFLEARGEDLADVRLKLAITTAETLLPQDEAVIRRVFGCPVANEYGCRDGALIAHAGPDGQLRLMHDAVHVEVLGPDLEPVAPGEEGEVTLTNFHAPSFPLVRYRIGDLITLNPDADLSDNPHPVVAAVKGRTTDLLFHQDGSRVHALAVIYPLRETPGVDRFRCTQTSRSHVRIEVIAGAGFDGQSAPSSIREGVRRALGADMDVDVSLVDELEPLPSGKHRYVVCDVDV